MVQVSMLWMPLWAYLMIYGLIIFFFLELILAYSCINRVTLVKADKPIEFSSSSDDGKAEKFTLIDLISESVPEFKDGALSLFNPFLINGHAHTMFAGIRKFSRSDKLYFGREIVKFSDGGSASLDRIISYDSYKDVTLTEEDTPKGQTSNISQNTRYLTRSELSTQASNDTKPMIIALHGLSGSSAEAYVRCLFSRLHGQHEFECFVLNSRGCGQTRLSTPQLFNGYWTDDFRFALKHLHQLFPNRPIYAVGFSLGGSILANYLGQYGDDSLLKLGCVIANPWDLVHSSFCFENDFISSKLYSPIMTVPLKQLLITHFEQLKENPIFMEAYESGSYDKVYKLKDFDDYFTSKLFGFNCAAEYYRNGSSLNRIFNIRTPTLIINSLDDPIVGGSDIAVPIKETTLHPYLTLVSTSLGGHLGWFKWDNTRWYADPLSKLISEFHDKVGSKDNVEIVVEEKNLPLVNKVVNGRLVGPFI
ncbi:hypothetical protein CANARDRAFT_30722 [[Candida] arabinofermentans NRRL YB-2248]|uniref:AB hydrolase-1 domain-containing protein n=1 Tax=[Candida] arabinofermentans NRRL YB-2248 TaxID=983967 RepID=A0A1E4ST01_9ASCO|nr:hypothetical protein CANARDRAFT_30722 [[Candida] arabinofermentans NRRL YB-2248]